MKLRYTGHVPTSFLSPPIGTVEPGQEFQVADEDADRLLRRSDVEAVEDVSEDTEDQDGHEEAGDAPEVAETPTERQDEAAPAPRRRARTDSSGSADTKK